MYCKNCRNRMPEGANVCMVCGANQGNAPTAVQPQHNNSYQGYNQNPYNQSSYNAQPYTPPAYVPPPQPVVSYGTPQLGGYRYKKDTSVIRVSIIIVSVIMLILSFVKGYYYSNSRYDFHGYELLTELLDNGGKELVHPLMFTICDLWIVVSCIAMVSNFAFTKHNPDSEFNAIGGYGYMVSVLIAVGINFFHILYLNEDIGGGRDVFSLSVSRYIVFILAIVNRCVLLPSYLSALRYNNKLKEEMNKYEKTESAIKSTVSPSSYSIKSVPPSSRVATYWRCPKCGFENSTIDQQCKSCGTYK